MLNIVVTTAGRAALVNADNTGTDPVAITEIGLSATAVVPAAGLTALAGEFKRISSISGEVVADDVIHVSMLDESADAYTLRSIALYLEDGTLFAIYGQAAAIIEKVASSMAALAVDVVFEDIDAALIEFGDTSFTNPPATTERQGVVELATVAEAQAGIDALRSLTPAAAKASILGWLLAQDGSGSGIDADLLDGQQGSYYTNIPARLGYTPANKAGDTFTGSIMRDGNFYLDIASSNPLINFDAYDYISFDRANDAMSIYIGGQRRLFARTTGNFELTATAALTFNGATVWHATNDGAGSGLDADLLDGQDGSYYTNIPARLGYTPLNKAGDTAGGTISFVTAENAAIATRPNSSTPLEVRGNGTGPAVLTFHRPSSHATFFGLDTDNKLKLGGWSAGAAAYEIWNSGNDGSGSGLDADLLDGLDSSYFVNIPARLGYTPLNKAGDTITGQLAITYGGSPQVHINSVGVVVAKLIAQSDGNVCLYRNVGAGDAFIWGVASQSGPFNVGVPIARQGNTVWDAGNDGSGSGLDADTLDGFHASQLLRILAESLGSNGYMQLSNGELLQWGRWTSSASAGFAVNVNFPVSFSAEPHTLVAMPVVTDTSISAAWSSDGIGGSSFPARCNRASIGCRYFAIGPV